MDKIAYSYFENLEVVDGSGKIVPICSVLPLLGIANPDGFLSSLASLGYSIESNELLFGDHHTFSGMEVAKITSLLEAGKCIVTSEKDFVRLPSQVQSKIAVMKGTLRVVGLRDYTGKT